MGRGRSHCANMDVRHHSAHAWSPPDVNAKSWGADRVEFLYGKVGGMGQNEGVWLCLESEGVIVVDFCGGEGDGAGLSGRAPCGGGLYEVNRLEESLCRWGEVSRHCSCVVGLSISVGGEEFV